MFNSTYSCDRSIEVYKQTKEFIKKENLEYELGNIAWTYDDIGCTIPQTVESYWSGHIFPYTESNDELQISCNLCFFGYYKQAMVSLRGVLELGLLSIYWNISDDGHLIIKDWMLSRDPTPFLPEIWKKIIKHQNIRKFQDEYDLRKKLLGLVFLSNYVHARGLNYSNRFGLTKPNFQTFEEAAFRMWIKTARNIVSIIAILHLLKYPQATIECDYYSKFGINMPMFGGLEEHQIERIKSIVGHEIYSIIIRIAKEDNNVLEIMNGLENIPNMSDDEKEQQIINFDKFMIEQMGFRRWLENEKSLPELAKENERYKKRLQYLKNWAEEKGYTTSPPF